MVFSVSVTKILCKSSVRKPISNCFRRYLTSGEITKHSTKIPSQDHEQPKFVKVYEMPYIRACSMVSRLKFYHTIATAVAIPCSMYAHYAAILPDAHLASVSLGSVGCLILYGTSFFFNNLIGAVYINETEDRVMLSHIDFWGRRVNTVCPVNDIVSLSEVTPKKGFFKATTVHRYSSPEIIQILTEQGIIHHPHIFDKIFFKISTETSEAYSVSQKEK